MKFPTYFDTKCDSLLVSVNYILDECQYVIDLFCNLISQESSAQKDLFLNKHCLFFCICITFGG